MKSHRKIFSLVFSASLAAVLLTSSCTHKSEKAQTDKKLNDARELMNKGDFTGASQMLTPDKDSAPAGTFAGAQDVSFLLSVCQTALGQKPDFQQLSILPPKERFYVLSLLTVLKPQVTLEYLHSRPSLEPQEAEFAWTALKLENQPQAEVQKQVDTWLFPPSAYEKAIQDVKIPKRGDPGSAFQDQVKTMVANTQNLRHQLHKETANRPPQVQLRILEADRSLEQQVANFIQSTPPPPKMPAARVAGYKTGLTNISREFTASADDISKNEAAIQLKMKTPDQIPARPNMGPDLKKWPWPQGVLTGDSGFEALNKAITDKNFTAALVLTDLLRAGPLKDNAHYYAVRSGLLLMVSGDEPMRSYILNELTSAKQDALIAQWKSLI
jgi:hypothetical protein